MRSAARTLAVVLALALLPGCGGGGGGGASAPAACVGSCGEASPNALTRIEVEAVVGRAVAEARARGANAHVAVTDRVGNVLAVYSMTGAPATIAVSSGLPAGGLEGIPAGTIPATFAAISKAITGAYLSSAGNAFTTRTAGQIVQELFNPGEAQQPAGPLYGVQFSQLTCSDVNRKRALHGDVGPKNSPLGLAADPGGLPLYKSGVLVGGIGVEADGRYGIDRDIFGIDDDAEEKIAVAASFGLAAPADIRGDRITADGRTFRYVDSESIASNPAQPIALGAAGAYVEVAGYTAGATPRAGTAFGDAASGIVPSANASAAATQWVLLGPDGVPRFPAHDAAAGAGPLTAAQVQALLDEGLATARRTRAQIRRPLGSFAQVTIAVVDLDGNILGLARTPDAPVFGIDVAVQKARTAMFFSHPQAAADLRLVPPARHLVGPVDVSVAAYLDAARAFLEDPTPFTGGTAWTARAIGNLHRPTYPDGIEGADFGPFSTPLARWSPFNVGFQLDLVYNQFVGAALGDVSEGCAGRYPKGHVTPGPFFGTARLRNGAQIFPGGVPVYRGETLVGGVGVSGDGVDQDDMIASLAIARAGERLAGAVAHAPAARRADRLVPHGARLRYVQCPQAPFLDSNEHDACAGL